MMERYDSNFDFAEFVILRGSKSEGDPVRGLCQVEKFT
jgi:hypothetical protein